ncbi:Benomyl/methotrexate resistance [Pseudocercospora fijiensis CIRAD86]|uniref:Cercosporin MFS transporter CTB4 n=1 Tax=Pseudocercospora fijiensis (strain CIRAD86) TaxID=383855 RepID=N1Q879_PSEFD|nr:Benomyl/methotrexate resistance [Pseudocercospora fijiensis CIRAD86]EME87996.1 Benomyl/methotrexate resistance [Pseudocercospora fijiensis CIRAD86]
MTDLIRDTAFGHLIRFVSRKKFLQYQEEADPSLYKYFIDEKKSGYLADHGDTNPRADGTEPETLGGIRTREERGEDLPDPEKERRSSDGDSGGQRSSSDDARINHASGVKVDPEKGRDRALVSWWGDNDPENPQNWSLFKKCFVTFEICLLTTSVYIGSSIYSAGTQSVMATFGVSQVAATLGLCLFVAGYGLGPMLWSPMSEIPQIGRNPIYLGTLVVFVGLQPAVARAENFGMLLAFRFITGFFGSPVLATGGASLADIWSPKKRAYAISIWGVAAVCGPTLGPLVGGFAVEYAPVKGGFTAPWTWPIWELMWLSAFCLVFLFFCFPETSANNILLRRTRRLRKITGNEKLICEPELMSEQMTGKEILLMAAVRPFTLNFMEPMVFLLNLYIALIYGLLYIWFESFVIVFVEIYGFGLGAEGLAFLGILIGSFVVIPPFFWYLHTYLEPKFDENGECTPEYRLTPCFVGAFCIPICLFWFGWSARPDVHWIVPIIGSAWFSIGAFLLFNSVLNYLSDAYPDYAASVLAGNDFFRSTFGTGFPLFAGAMYKNLGVAWASSTLAFLSIAFIPIPFVLYKYGETLRKNYSKHARKDI